MFEKKYPKLVLIVFIIQLFFSFYYSSEIINQNQKLQKNQDKYQKNYETYQQILKKYLKNNSVKNETP
jgi:hypothetical protein